MQSQMQNFRKPPINSSFINTLISTQLDTTLNVTPFVNDVPATLDMSQVSTMTPIITSLITLPNMNDNQAFNIQEMTPSHALHPLQDYQQVPHPTLLAHFQETVSELSFFYTPCN